MAANLVLPSSINKRFSVCRSLPHPLFYTLLLSFTLTLSFSHSTLHPFHVLHFSSLPFLTIPVRLSHLPQSSLKMNDIKARLNCTATVLLLAHALKALIAYLSTGPSESATTRKPLFVYHVTADLVLSQKRSKGMEPYPLFQEGFTLQDSQLQRF